MNRNLIICLAFLVTAQTTRAMEKKEEKIKLGGDKMVLTGHIAKALFYNEAPFNKVVIYSYKKKKLVNEGFFGDFKKKQKEKFFFERVDDNYVFISGTDPKLALGIKDKAEVVALLDSAKKTSLLKKTIIASH